MCNPEIGNKLALSSASAPVLGRSGWGVWLMAAMLALMTFVLYWPATSLGFVDYDDNVYVTENPHVQNGLTWNGLKWAFTNTEYAAYWAPMMWLSQQLACQFFGLNPWGHHLVNVLLHVLNTALVFILFRRMTKAIWRSFFVAALFGWHPLRVESVAWVTERKDVLSACFGLLSLIYYVGYAQSRATCNPTSSAALAKEDQRLDAAERNGDGSTFRYLLALVFFALGLMSKPMLVTWPLLMLLLDWWPLERFRIQGSVFKIRSLVWEKAPFFGLAVVTSAVTFAVQKRGGAVESFESLPLVARGGNALIFILPLFGEAVLAGGFGGILSVFEVLADGRGVAGGGVALGHYSLVHHGGAALPVYADRLAVVRRDVGAGNRTGTGGVDSAGGSVHIYSLAGGAHSCNLGRD